MTDATDLQDPMHVAFRIVELEGRFALLQQQTNSGIHNLTSSTQALQAEVRAMHQKFDALPQIQQQQASLGEAIDRAFNAIAQLATSTSEKLNAFDKESRDTRTKMAWWSGGAAVLAAVASIVVGVGMWYEGRISEIEERERATQSTLVIENSKRIREAELFIARTNREKGEGP